MGRLCITYRPAPEKNRWFPGDRWARPVVRRLIRGPRRPGGLDKVLINLRLGLDRLRISYELNLPFSRLRPDDLVGVLGIGKHCLEGYRRKEPLVAGIGLMTHPTEWPSFFEDYPVRCYLQHCAWARDVYRKYFGNRCTIWPVGIDSETWKPVTPCLERPVDFLIYEKLRWDHARYETELVNPIADALRRLGKSSITLHYGAYQPQEYRTALERCRAMIFLCSHESQGIACGEAMASDVPVLAWDPGRCLDPERFKWGDPDIPTTSVPYFDERCGRRFKDSDDFQKQLGLFLEDLASARYAPRQYMLENLTVEKCSRHFVDILKEKLS